MKYYFILVTAWFLIVTAPGRGQTGGDFTYIENQSLETLDPITYPANEVNDRISSLLYSSLFSYNDEPRAVPDMVEKIDPNENTFTLTLYKGMKWSDGSEVTVDDVIETIKLIKNPRTVCSADPYLPKSLQAIDKWERISKLELQLKFNSNYNLNERKAALVFPVMPKKEIENMKDGMKRNNNYGSRPVGSGPFYFDTWPGGETIVLRRNPDYQRNYQINNPRPIQVVSVLSNSDDPIRAEKFMSHKADMLINTPWESIQKIRTHTSEFAVISVEELSYYYIGFNFRDPRFQSPAVREAISKAIDRKGILYKIYFDYGSPIGGPFPPGTAYCDPTVRSDEFSPETSNQLLDDAGIRDSNKDGIREYQGKPFKVQLLYKQIRGSEGDKYTQVCTYIKDDLRKIGIDVEIEGLGAAQYEDRLFKSHNFDLSFGRWRFSDLQGDPSSLFLSTDTKNNYIGYSNQKIDEWFKNFLSAKNVETRKEIGMEIHAQLAKERPYVFLWNLKNQHAYNMKRLSQVNINPFSFFDSIGEWRISK